MTTGTVNLPESSAGVQRGDSQGEPQSGRASAAAAVGVTPQSRTALDVLAWAQGVVDPALRVAVDRLPGSMRRIAGYHLGWWDPQGRPTGGRGGKAVRPALVLLSACAVGGRAEAVVPAAVAVELVHNSTLLHDDVMDGDRARRHRPTAWSVFGVASAILAGDALLALASQVLVRQASPLAPAGVDRLNATCLLLCEAQYADIAFEERNDVGLDECLAMVAGKTASLLGCACALGGSLGGADLARVGLLYGFGLQLGMAFQLVDDLLGIWGRPEVTGKPAWSDLARRKQSLPVVAALASDTSAGRDLAVLYRSDEALSAGDLANAAKLIEAAGGRRWAQQEADRRLAAAVSCLKAAGSEPQAVAELLSLARFVTRRDH
jgi:geranylgeranyl diphosphate synthase, type I